MGTDIGGGDPAPTFNAAFALFGDTDVPEPASLSLFAVEALFGLGFLVRRSRAV